jgi:hypothetical protein
MDLEELRRERDRVVERERRLRARIARLESEVAHARRVFQPEPFRCHVWWFLVCAFGAFMVVETIVERL